MLWWRLKYLYMVLFEVIAARFLSQATISLMTVLTKLTVEVNWYYFITFLYTFGQT